MPHDAWGPKPPVSMSDELRRVMGLPRRALELDGTDRAEAIIDMMTERYARPAVPGRKCRCAEVNPDRHNDEGCITRLRLAQAQALREIVICGGLLAPIGVGHGKTLVDLLAAFAFMEHEPKMKKILLLVPSSLAKQLSEDYVYYGQHFRMPQIIFHGDDGEDNTLQKMNPWVPLDRGAPCIHVLSYTMLSRPDATSWLEQELKPDAIVADECHKLRYCCPDHPTKRPSATGVRVWRYMEDIAPHTRFAGLSGSMTSKDIADYWHLAMWALRGGSPLPTNLEVVLDWGRGINPSENPADPGPLMGFCAEGEHIRDGFKRRLVETVGFVSTTAPAVDVPLELKEMVAPSIPPLVRQYLNTLRQDSTRPDGEELLTSLEKSACAMQLACGFYYRWIYPDCEFPRDEELVREWKGARKEYFAFVRRVLQDLAAHLDSPRLVMNACERGAGLRPKNKGMPVIESKEFARWHKVAGMVRAVTQAVWFDDYLVNDAIAWGQAHKGIIWYEHATVGERLSKLSGLPVYGAGSAAKKALLGDQKNGIDGERGDRTVICSIKALGTGTNGLQHRFHEALLLYQTWEVNAVEQVLGRLHRPGQKHTVTGNFYRHTEELKKHIDNAVLAAQYIQGTGFGSQKIIAGFAS
jgi:hypothetical protein